VPRTTRVSLRVYDVDGRLVRKLTDRVAVAGEHTARWDGRDETGVPVASGIYYYRIDAAGFRASGKMVMAP
jgi:flagellar hook assembly protein FlgD